MARRSASPGRRFAAGNGLLTTISYSEPCNRPTMFRPLLTGDKRAARELVTRNEGAIWPTITWSRAIARRRAENG
jgi:hypothetical protein